MSEMVPAQHPAVVLRAHYVQLRAMLAVALTAIVGLTVAVVVLATNHGSTSTAASPAVSASAALPASASAGATLDHRGLKLQPSATTRYDGGPEEGTRGPSAAASPRSANAYSYNGGHEEGIAGATIQRLSPTSSTP
jgi:hypothetical protein